MQAQRLYPGFPTPPGVSTGRYSPTQYARTRHCMTNPPTNFFGGIDESLFQQARAEAALMDMKAVPRPTDVFNPYHHHLPSPHPSPHELHLPDPMAITSNHMAMTTHHNSIHSSMADQPMVHTMAAMHPAAAQFPQYSHPGFAPMAPPPHLNHSALQSPPCPSRYPSGLPSIPTNGEPDTDPRELERFAEHFKQRRIKLGVTQADVGKALAHLKMPGVGSLSQSTICRFESLTLSHNNMVALKPILHSWLEKAEDASKGKDPGSGILPNAEKKRKRTSIAAPEKRSLEAYFAIQPRPSGEKIAAIAEKLDLKKNVVRVWFCNQRQKQKRWRYSAGCSKDVGIKQELM